MDGYDTECVCIGDYTGPYCETPKVASAKNCLVDSDCQNGGTCGFDATATVGVCDCPSDHYGYHCQERCPCFNGGTCKTEYSTGLYECQCTEEFYDHLCTGRWDGEGGHSNRAQSMLIVLLAITLGLFFCLVYLACSKGEKEEVVQTGNPGLVKTASGKIVYSEGDTDPSDESAEEDTTKPSSPVTENTEPDSLTDLELL